MILQLCYCIYVSSIMRVWCYAIDVASFGGVLYEDMPYMVMSCWDM